MKDYPKQEKDSAKHDAPSSPESEEGLGAMAGSRLPRFKWRVGGTLDLYDSGDIYSDEDGEWVRYEDAIEAISDLEDRLAGITIHSCHSQCQRPACVARRERDEARQLAKEARDLLESEGYAVNPLPWESPKNGAAHASEEGPTNQEEA